ncbi:MAG: hypothetical protein GXO08_06060 [Aquificae bacterium]|nr:hypothetical protein [Aquificota bacterium]
MEVLEYLQTLLGDEYGRVLSACKGGSWLYTPAGRVKVCVPRLEVKGEGRPLEEGLSSDLLEEEVLFVETDRGLVVKEGSSYRFYPKGTYELVWKR